MRMEIYIMPHERADAIEAYADRLSKGQLMQIANTAEDKTIKISYDLGDCGCDITIQGENK